MNNVHKFSLSYLYKEGKNRHVSFRRAVGLHEEDGAIPVDPLNISVLCESIEFFNRERYVADVVELSKVVVNSLGDGKDRSTAGLVLVLDVCLCFVMS